MKRPFAFALLMLCMCLAMGQVEYLIPFPPYNLPVPKGSHRVTEHYSWGKADSVADQQVKEWTHRITEYDAEGMLRKIASTYYRTRPNDTTLGCWMVQISPNDPYMRMLLPCDESGVKLRLPLEHYAQMISDTTGRIVRYRDFCEMNCERRLEYTFQYDESGKLTQIRDFDPGWRGVKHWKFSYDETGTLTCLQEIQPEGDADTYQYRYDGQGRLESTRLNLSYFLPKRWFVTKYTYDVQGRIVKAVTYMDNRRQVVHWTIFYFYDAG